MNSLKRPVGARRSLGLLSALLLAALAPQTLPAQVGYDGPNGRVEVMGLKTWTLPMLRDSIRHYVPGQDLHDAACMATLREKLGFADALVAGYGSYNSDKVFLLIKVVEPKDRARVQWRKVTVDSLESLHTDYASLILPITDSTGGIWTGRFMNALQFGDSASRAKAAEEMEKAIGRKGEVADAQRLTQFLSEHRDEASGRRALRRVSKDAFWVNRMTAAVVLANFSERDSTWLALVSALRDPNEGVRGAAAGVLRSFPTRTVDWAPAATDLRILLGGTNVAVIGEVFRLLVNTNISPALAGPLLRDNASWVLDHLGSAAPGAASDARALLKKLNGGRDLGATRADWEAWIRTL